MLLELNLTAISGILIATSSLFMSILMLSVAKNTFSRIWGIFCLAVFIWGVSFFFIATSASPEEALVWWRISHVGVILIPALFIHFVFSYLGKTDLKTEAIVIGVYGISLFLLFADLASQLLIDGVRFAFSEYYYDTPGILYAPFVLYFHALIIYGHYLLYRAYKKATDDAKKQQIRYFFMATLVGFLGGGVSFSPVFGVDMYPTTIITVTLYPIIMGYAILYYGLFSSRIVVAQILSIVVFSASFIRLFFATSSMELLISGALTVFSLLIGAYLVKSVESEVKARETVELKERELQVSNRQQESLLHFISHEIKGYLTKNEAAFAAIAAGDFGPVAEPLKNMSSAALTDTRKGVATVMDILDASNLKKGTVMYAKKDFDLGKALADVIVELQASAQEKGLSLTFAGTDSCLVTGDEDKIRRHVLRNVIDNSIKYTQHGSVAVTLNEAGSTARIEVADTGVGITPEDMKRLFTEGGHGAESIKVNVHSTGYGLFIAKQIVDAHGGTIRAESNGKGKGSRFIIEMPLSK